MLTHTVALSTIFGCAAGSFDNAPGTVDLTVQAIVNGWTPYTSEELQPIQCERGALFSAVQCDGDYCDNVRGYCQATGGTTKPAPGSTAWTPGFSEETAEPTYCPEGSWIAGLACEGDYCDNFSLFCASLENQTWGAVCGWTGWTSEEDHAPLIIPQGYYPNGAECHGSFCDNMRFHYCDAAPLPHHNRDGGIVW